MPSYRGHLVGGVLAYLGMLQLIKYAQPNIHVIVQGLIFCLLGSLFPDIDVKSKGQKLFYTILLIFLCYCLLVYLWDIFIVVTFLGIMPLLVRHRGIFHEIWFLLFLILGLFLFLTSCNTRCGSLLLSNCSFFFAGCLSHLFLDRFVSRLKRYF